MSMAASLEARAPFLDRALVEYVAGLPDDYKLRGRTTKAVLREAFADLIPEPVKRRGKKGFGVPLDAWFRHELRDYARDHLLSPSAKLRAYVSPAFLAQLLDAHQQRTGQPWPSHLDAPDLRALVAAPAHLEAQAVTRVACTVDSDDRPRCQRGIMAPTTETMNPLVQSFALGLGLSAALVPVCRVIARRFGVVAHPRDDRWHRTTVPLLGGLALAVTLLVGMLVTGAAFEMVVPLAAALLISIVGLVDDVLSLKPATKLIAQIALAAAARVLRLSTELARVAAARQPRDDRLGGRADQRLQPARQHGRPVRRHRADRGGDAHGGHFDRRHPRPGEQSAHVSRAPRRRHGRISDLQLSAGVDLHGRRRQPAARLQPGGADAESRRRPRQPRGRRLGHHRAGVRAADPDLRYEPGHRAAAPVRPIAGPRRPRPLVASPRRDGTLGTHGDSRPLLSRGGRRRDRQPAASGRGLVDRCRRALRAGDGPVCRLSRPHQGLRRSGAGDAGTRGGDAARRRVPLQAPRRRGDARLLSHHHRLLRCLQSALRGRRVSPQRRGVLRIAVRGARHPTRRLLHCRRLPRGVAALRPHGRRHDRQGRRARHCGDAADRPLRLPVPTTTRARSS